MNQEHPWYGELERVASRLLLSTKRGCVGGKMDGEGKRGTSKTPARAHPGMFHSVLSRLRTRQEKYIVHVSIRGIITLNVEFCCACERLIFTRVINVTK